MKRQKSKGKKPACRQAGKNYNLKGNNGDKLSLLKLGFPFHLSHFNLFRLLISCLLSVAIIALITAGIVFAVDVDQQVAGGFYPEDKAKLSKDIDYYLSKYKFIENSGSLVALVSPHAGYDYSGIVAAYGYKQLLNRSYDTVIIMGPAHQMYFEGISVNPSGKYRTPLGEVEIDEVLAYKLIKYNSRIKYDKRAFIGEHSVEVQMPFIQKTLGNVKIVPVIFGSQTIDDCMILSDAIIDSIGNKKVLLIASTDLSHYLSYEAANAMDNKVLQAFSQGDLNHLIEMIATKEVEMCGYGPVISTMYTAGRLGGNSYEVLKYLNSGNTTSDSSRVVGYMSAAIYKRPIFLDDMQRSRLLQIARDTLDSYYKKNGIIPSIEVYDKDLQAKSGVFVTLNKEKELKGCIGYIFPVKPLYQAVQDNAISAATQDIRFTPITTEELDAIKIEISVLSPLREIKNTNEVKVGQHGLLIVKNRSSGILLPQVAIDNRWDREEFLDNVCYKAGLAPSAWKDKDSKIYIFEAQVFKEY